MTKDIKLNLNLESTPILYTDNVFMTTNEYGVVLDVTQRLASSDQVQIVTRVGMSRTHAQNLVKELGKLLAMTSGQVKTSPEKKN